MPVALGTCFREKKLTIYFTVALESVHDLTTESGGTLIQKQISQFQ